jgi:transcriptional regulator with XRE-family HTH domain
MSKEVRLAFGREVKEARERRQMTQEQLADKVGVHQAYISHIERGRFNARIDTMAAIAVALDLHLGITIEEERASA